MLDASSSVVHCDECGALLIVVLVWGKNCPLVLLFLKSDEHFSHGQNKAACSDHVGVTMC
jgi:hypothetical protein